MKNDILAGYQLSITSWENDADNYRTIVLNGLSETDVRFYLHFLRHFHAKYCFGDVIGEGFGGKDIYEYPNAQRIALTSALQMYPNISYKLKKRVEEELNHNAEFEGYESNDFVYELIDNWPEAYCYRTFDTAKVYYIPVDCPDMTYKFDPKNDPKRTSTRAAS